MIILAYIGLGVLSGIISLLIGVVVAVLQGRADPFLAHPPAIVSELFFLGLATLLVIVYLYRHHHLATGLWVLAPSAVVGFVIGLDPRKRW